VNWPLLSSREALRRFPHQLRFFIFVLMMVAFVAPTWHVCMLGGHANHQNSSHHEKPPAPVVQASTNGERQALVCYCPPREHSDDYPNPTGAILATTPEAHEHPTCLALLLQGMPAVLAFSPQFLVTDTPLQVGYLPASYSLNSRFFALYNGRAPPVSL
jgi:hypothetical protein